MIHSMTGFGEGRAAVGSAEASVEMRSVNARHLDLKVRLPGALGARTSEAQALLQERFARGRITARVQLEDAGEGAVLPIEVDEEAAAAHAALLRRLAAAAGLSQGGRDDQHDASLRLEHLLHFSDVFTSRDDDAPADDAWAATAQALAAAADDLRNTRRREGEALQDDLEARLDAIAGGLEKVEARAPERIEERRVALRERLDELFDDERVAAGRLEAELALTAEKLDVTEECVRLRAHVEAFREALGGEGPAGRRLKFLTQELHREANTIGAKANDPALSHYAVAIKEEVEKIREQIRNVE
jgi:uncharacterized protein (TIGR00255 family)